MLLNMSPLEQKWLIRILLKNISVGLSQNRIMYHYHPDAVDLFDVTNDLKKVNLKFDFFHIICYCVAIRVVSIIRYRYYKMRFFSGLYQIKRSECKTTRNRS